ncbi:hypothetical protein V6N12_007526 [Hibiscus sabdariffa]|uniref:BED-type domain-containing protein n=1 Tax=Hibiscus sabdariffa TaxID=183260 RepID=A0ABR2F240_9ROSI
MYHSTPILEEFGVNLDDANEMDEDETDLENAGVRVPQTTSEVRNIEDESESYPFKIAKKSAVWKEFGEPQCVGSSKVWKVPCVYCKTLLTISKGGPTSHLKRHLDKCTQRKVHIRQQKLINFLPSDSTAGSPSSEFVNALYDVDYLNGSEQRLKKFAELAQKYNLKERRLVLECKTRWNSTYEMLACAIKFKEISARRALEDKKNVYCPSLEDWDKIEKLLEILKVFYDTRIVISGSEYLTSNLFLTEIYRIKLLLDTSSKSSDDFVKGMVTNMKERFDKYWGECNLIMAIGAVLDPRLKMKVIEITFPKMFSPDVVRENINKVRETLYELYDEYVNLYSPPLMEQMGECGTSANVCGGGIGSTPGLLEILQVVRSEELIENKQSEVDLYLEEGKLMKINQRKSFCLLFRKSGEEQRMECLEHWTRIMEGRSN